MCDGELGVAAKEGVNGAQKHHIRVEHCQLRVIGQRPHEQLVCGGHARYEWRRWVDEHSFLLQNVLMRERERDLCSQEHNEVAPTQLDSTK